MERTNNTPFIELPEALVEEMLSRSENVAERIYLSFKGLQEKKNIFREQLKKSGLLRNDSEIIYPEMPTTCGVDGSYAIEKLLAIDFAACAAVAIEGLTPPSEKRYWEKPNHRVFIQSGPHDPDTGTVLRALMILMEIELAAQAPHDIVFLDGSLTTPVIFMNQAVNKIIEWENKGFITEIGTKIKSEFNSFLMNYKTILEANRNDKQWASISKYSSRKEISDKLSWQTEYDDKAILTQILFPGEYTSPVELEIPNEKWHLRVIDADRKLENLSTAVISAINRINVIYYRPHNWLPALRIEIAPSIAENGARLAVLLQGIKYQCGTPGIFEPYPLYIADRIVKHLGNAIPAFRQSATKRMTDLHQGDVGEIFFSMHGYRTERGR